MRPIDAFKERAELGLGVVAAAACLAEAFTLAVSGHSLGATEYAVRDMTHGVGNTLFTFGKPLYYAFAGVLGAAGATLALATPAMAKSIADETNLRERKWKESQERERAGKPPAVAVPDLPRLP